MQLVGGSQRILVPGQPLIFDMAINDQSPDIGYNLWSGEFIINQTGNYFVSWWVATDGAESSPDQRFSLKINSANYAIGATPVVTGQLSGSALVTVNSAPATLTLNNAAEDAVALASTPVQANILILELS